MEEEYSCGNNVCPRKKRFHNTREILWEIKLSRNPELINKRFHIVIWQPNLFGIDNSFNQSGFRIIIITPTNYLANKKYQSLCKNEVINESASALTKGKQFQQKF